MAMASLNDPGFPQQFASAWINNWNNRDIKGVLQHFDDDCTFESPIAETVTGDPVVHGKAALEAYWTSALDRIKSLHFELENVVWDPERRALVVVYIAHIDARTTRSCEIMLFDEFGRQKIGRAYSGFASK